MVRLIGLVVISFVLATSAGAQIRGDGVPAEFPPESFSANQYVDSKGCAFVRAGLSGTVTWVPRVRQDRSQLCGLEPSISQAATAVQPVVADAPLETSAGFEQEGEGAPTDTIVSNEAAQEASPVTAVRTSEPAQASVIPAPSLAPPPPLPAARPGLVASRRVGDPIRTVASIVTPPVIRSGQDNALASQPPATPYLEACAGLTGIQPHLINRVTGQAIDCGPADAGDIQSEAASVTGVPRMTLAEACAIAAQSRRPVINQATGRPINCVAAPSAASSSARASGPIAGPPPGYRGVWADGRVNPQRGIPAVTERPLAQPTTSAASAQAGSEQTGLVPVGAYFVQVGTYGVPSNADRAAGRVRAMGYPVAFARLQRQGRALQAVAAGPFSDVASVNAALSWARSAGYSDAFVRR